MAQYKELFEAAVAGGKTNWTKQDWDALGVPASKDAKTFLCDYERARPITGDVVHILVNGTQVHLHGTSNMNAEERKAYNAARNSGSGTPRATTSVATSTNRDMAKKLLATFEAGSVTKEQQLMLLQLAGASETARNLFATFENCTLEQLQMLMSM